MFGIPEKTFELALALAEAFGHLWARYARERWADRVAQRHFETVEG